MLKHALEIAKNAHNGQTDKGGSDYFSSHILAVVNSVDGEMLKTIAALHDVVEDTDVTLEDLSKEFPKAVVDAVDAMTHRKGIKYFDYINIIKQNPLATEVKKADLRNNMDLSRIPAPTEKDYARVEKYKKAYAILENA